MTTTLAVYTIASLIISIGAAVWVTEHLDVADDRCIRITRLWTLPCVVLAPLLLQVLSRHGKEWAALIVACFVTFLIMNAAFLVAFTLGCPQKE